MLPGSKMGRLDPLSRPARRSHGRRDHSSATWSRGTACSPLSGLTGPAQLLIPTTPFPAGAIAAGIAVTANGPIPTAPTTWVQAFSYQGACRTINSAHIYRYHPVDGSRALTEFPPTWGSHLFDFNLGTERLTTIARLQTQSWLAARYSLGRKDRNARRGTATLAVDAPGAGTVTLTAPGVSACGSRARGR